MTPVDPRAGHSLVLACVQRQQLWATACCTHVAALLLHLLHPMQSVIRLLPTTTSAVLPEPES